ncbi:unnamed protein product [Caenorhabditis auriculariae]|uniref:Uncharacterized protein n=1 Tax=Caenorhabditis auriculariae TaxID=2777116 RepID=A0A8S1HD16_9PELO|nr:unnamed protein product [Caenorhabditis auriculariae]
MMREILLITLLVGSLYAFRTQSTAVKGKLMCGNRPAEGIHVKLFDEDDGPDPDDILDQMLTREDGTFSLSGSSMELTPIDPEIRIYHDCNDHGKPCQREWVIRIPNKYITSGPSAIQVMDLGNMNLEVELDNEGRSCIH